MSLADPTPDAEPEAPDRAGLGRASKPSPEPEPRPGSEPASAPGSWLPAAARRRLEWLARRYPERGALLFPLLAMIEREVGAVDARILDGLARELQVAPERILSALASWSDAPLEGGGRHVIRVCRSVSCGARGAGEIVRYLESRLGIRVGETTPDGRFTLLEVDCLGDCDVGPAARIGHEACERLTPAKVEAIVESLE